MNKNLLFIFLISLSLNIGAQNEKQISTFIKDNIVQLESTKPLFNLKEVLKNKKIVLLGEQTHGDGSTFALKSELVKYLHDSLNFNVLIFESDFYALNKLHDSLSKYKMRPDSGYYFNNMHSVWGDAIECEYLFFNYLRDTQNNDLMVSGIDNQFFGHYSIKNLKHQLIDTLQTFHDSLLNVSIYQFDKSQMLDSFLCYYEKDTNRMNDLYSCLSKINKRLGEISNAKFFYQQVVNNLLQEINMRKATIIWPQNENDINIRDKQMYLNLKWLLKNKININDKIIIWSTNSHIMRVNSHLNIYTNYKNLGQYISEDSSLTSISYHIGFTSKKGKSETVTYPEITQIKKTKKSFESFVPNHIKLGFIDMTKYNGDYFSMNSMQYYSAKANWSKSFDGIFYIKKMYPATKR